MTESVSFGTGGLLGQRWLGSLILLTATPLFALTMWYLCFEHKGSLVSLVEEMNSLGFVDYLKKAIPDPFDPLAWRIMLTYMVFELFLMRVVPGNEFRSGLTPTGHVPVYKANGVQCYFISIITLLVGFYSGYIPLGLVYDNMGKLLAASNVFALCLCVFLVIKGLNFPSTKDFGSSGSYVIDFWWGTELYPRIFGFDIKQFTNCRYGMMFWQLGLLCYAAKQYENVGYVSSSMFASVFLQSVYICKFYIWETGYFNSMDIQHDRAGYYICWGCMVWLPIIYTLHTYFLVEHPILLSIPTTLLIIFCGLACIYINYDCDRQRQSFRGNNGTNIKIWGNLPDYITAKYRNKDTGKEHSSLLLLSGWWGFARHFHYVPEIGAAFFWSVPALFTHCIPYFYVFFLTILLFDRAWRDDSRCNEKYGKHWTIYCNKVPHKVIPGII